MSVRTRDERLTTLWEATDRLLDGATVPGVLAHKLGPLAANRARRVGEPVPEPFAFEERAASLAFMTSTPLIERIRASCDGPLVLIKGPEVTRLYPGRARRFFDVDVLTPDAEAVQRALLSSGFVDAPDPGLENFSEHHHLHPLRWPTIGLRVEIHMAPNWPPHAEPPPLEEIIDASRPSTVGVDGVHAPTPLHHALILTAHAWRHEPLRTLRDLLDIAAVSAVVDERDLERTASAWGLARVWNTTRRTIDSVLYGGRRTAPLRSWARHLCDVRERTVFESHLERLVHGYWDLPPHRAAGQSLRAVRTMIEPLPGESWRDKLSRAAHAARSARSPVSRRGARNGPAPDE